MPVPAQNLRAATMADIPALSDVARRSYHAAFAGILTAAELAERSESYFSERFALTWPKVTVIEVGGRLAGFAMLSQTHIDMLFLDPDIIGRGLGRALLADLEQQGAETLECFADNLAARGFYEHLGWRLLAGYSRPYFGRDISFVRYTRLPA